ncbi:MAG: response regulator [Terriglobales bacterium]|jgi:DNA-binding response OmpR family regulator
MGTNSTLLCIHGDPAQLSLLQENGYELVTAANGSDGLRLFMSRPVDAVVLEYHLGLLDGAVVADEIKHVRPDLPIVMLADHMELPDGALKSVDALVAKSDGARFLLATVHFVMNVKPAQRRQAQLRALTPVNPRGPSRPETGANAVPAAAPQPLADDPQALYAQPINDATAAPFSREVWRSIRDGSIQF